MKRVAFVLADGALSACAAPLPPSTGLAAADARVTVSPPPYDAVITVDYAPTGPGNWLERNQGVGPGAPR